MVRLARSNALVALLGVLSWSPAAAASIDMTVVTPTQGQLINGDTVSIEVRVVSTYAIQGVSAEIDATGCALTFQGSGWKGAIPLAGMAQGTKTLTLTATDLLGNTATHPVSFNYYLPPVITIYRPVWGDVARPSLELAATCSSATGCTSLEARYKGVVVAQGLDSIHGVIDLSAYDGADETLTFVATDAWQSSSAGNRVIVEGSPNLLLEDEIEGGEIVDFDSTRILAKLKEPGTPLRLHDRKTGQASIVRGDLLPDDVSRARLSPKGVILIDRHEVWEWSAGQLVKLSYPAKDLRVAGKFATWCYTNGSSTCAHLDLDSGLLSPAPGGTLAEDGSVTYTEITSTWNSIYTLKLFLWRQGVTEEIPQSLPVSMGMGPCCFDSDGRHFLYLESLPPSRVGLKSLSGGSIEGILEPNPTGRQTKLGRDFQIDRGWVAFTKFENGVIQVWQTDTGTGLKKQLTLWGSDSYIDSIDGAGSVMAVNQQRRHLFQPGKLPLEVGTTNGLSRSMNGAWYVAMGRSLFVVAGTKACSNQPDGTPCDDGDKCTQGDTCISGACAGGPPPVCASPTACQRAKGCDFHTGACVTRPAPDGEPCAAGTCLNGVCVPPAADAGPDASTADSGSPPTDAGAWDADAAPGEVDAGAPSLDAAASEDAGGGESTADAGSGATGGDVPSSEPASGCSTSGAATAPVAPLLMIMLIDATKRFRRRRSAQGHRT